MSLEATLVLARGQQGLALSHNVLRALRAPHSYLLGELLDMPNVQALGASHAGTLSLLTLLVHGTYTEYKASREAYPDMDEALLTKLKVLSLVSIASARKSLPYAELAAELDCRSVPELEALVVTAVDEGLLRARMDQRSQMVEVTHCAGRDVRVDKASLTALLEKLDAW